MVYIATCSERFHIEAYQVITEINTCTAWKTVTQSHHYLFLYVLCLRAVDSKNGESNDSSENSHFLLLRQKDPFGELFSEIYFKSSSELTFF